MTTELYDLQITGVISPEVERDAAISAFAKVLKISLSKAQQVFAHAPVTIIENIDHDRALIIESALARYRIESQRLPVRSTLSSAEIIQEAADIILPVIEGINKPYKGLNRVKIKADLEIGDNLADLERYK
jgi:hypothetical protein